MRDSFVLYTEINEVLEELTNEQKGILFQIIVDYEIDGYLPEINDPVVKVAFIPVRQMLDRNNEQWEKTKEARREAGKKGGEASASKRKQNQANASKTKQSQANAKQNKANQAVYVPVNEPVNVPVPEPVNEPVNVPEEKTKRTQAQVVEESDLSDPTKPVVIEWLKYKHENRFNYKETGLKTLLTQVRQKELDHGQNYVRECIESSISSGYQGIVWKDRASPQPKGINWDKV